MLSITEPGVVTTGPPQRHSIARIYNDASAFKPFLSYLVLFSLRQRPGRYRSRFCKERFVRNGFPQLRADCKLHQYLA